jgi:hypothetical protein
MVSRTKSSQNYEADVPMSIFRGAEDSWNRTREYRSRNVILNDERPIRPMLTTPKETGLLKNNLDYGYGRLTLALLERRLLPYTTVSVSLFYDQDEVSLRTT